MRIITNHYHSLDVHPGVNALQGLLLAAVSGATNGYRAANLIPEPEALPAEGNGPVEDRLELGSDVSEVDGRGHNYAFCLLHCPQDLVHIIFIGTGFAFAAVSAVAAKIKIQL